MNRIKTEYVYVRNPMNVHQISQISLSPDVVDGIVFWTKNPIPMLPKLNELKDYMYYFQFTITPYSQEIEENIPDKYEKIIPAFQRLSDLIGSDRVIWRYDPIFFNAKDSMKDHLFNFERMAKLLAPHTQKCIISFLDQYSHLEENSQHLTFGELPDKQLRQFVKELAEIAYSHGLEMDTCAEKIDLSEFGIGHTKCIDGQLFEKLIGIPMKIKKDGNQRSECGCMKSIDIGAYETCIHHCRYCYATHSYKAAYMNYRRHAPNSPLLIGDIELGDKITIREMSSCKENQLRFEI